MSLYDRLSQLIKDSGLSVYEVASKTGVSQGQFSRLKNGKQVSLNPKNIQILADYFHVDAHWLRSGKGEMRIQSNEPLSMHGPPTRTNEYSALETRIIKLEAQVEMLTLLLRKEYPEKKPPGWFGKKVWRGWFTSGAARNLTA